MPTVRIPIDLTWSVASGSPGVNVWHARVDSVADPNPDVQAMADMLETFYDSISNALPNQLSVKFNGEAHGVGDDSDDIFTGDPWVVTGSGGTEFLPPANCLLVAWRTASGGRQGRGRTFIGPLCEAALESNGTPDEPTRVFVQSAIDALVGSSTGFGNGALGIYSRVGNTFRDFTSGSCPNYFAQLRSRRD